MVNREEMTEPGLQVETVLTKQLSILMNSETDQAEEKGSKKKSIRPLGSVRKLHRFKTNKVICLGRLS